MTQNTQTTAERIARLIDENYQIHGLRADYETAKIVARELDARQAQIDALTADNAQANQWLVNGVAKIERLEKERDEARAEARAEVERLRPAAEAWRTLEAARKEERTGTDENEHAEYWVHILARNAARAADRARAAKEAKA